MTGETTAYMIELSEKSRSILDREATELLRERAFNETGSYDTNSTRRASLKHYFHNSYYDRRPEWLIRARAWSLEERKFKTYVMLTKEQIAQVLQLSIDMDIDPKPNATNTMNPSQRGTVRYLLGTFLEAVIFGYLVKKEDSVN